MTTDAEFIRRARQSRARRSGFASVRVAEGALARHLRSRHILWLHGWAMGLLTLGVMWVTTNVLRIVGVDTLALRYALTLGMGYLCYLVLVRIWAGILVRREEPDAGDLAELTDLGFPSPGGRGPAEGGAVQSGGGGDFGGGGAHGSFDLPADLPSVDALADGAFQAATDGAADAGGSLLGDAASGAFEVAGAADEGAIVIIPVLAVFMAALATLLGAGWLVWLVFGTEALLVVAVELAFAYTASRTVVRVEREGWLLAAIRLTWKPLLGALISAVILGALIDHFVPHAATLAEAVQWWRGH